MAVFFLLVGLETKHEFIEGQLSTKKQALLPFFGAVGGMIVPATIYVYINYGHDPPTLNGWAIPATTDIAFALGILALVGSRAPLSPKVRFIAIGHQGRHPFALPPGYCRVTRTSLRRNAGMVQGGL